jgi:hypothetical protein
MISFLVFGEMIILCYSQRDYISFSSKLKTEALRAAQRIDEHQLMKNKSFIRWS